jgi:hypothetical protein
MHDLAAATAQSPTSGHGMRGSGRRARANLAGNHTSGGAAAHALTRECQTPGVASNVTPKFSNGSRKTLDNAANLCSNMNVANSGRR